MKTFFENDKNVLVFRDIKKIGKSKTNEEWLKSLNTEELAKEFNIDATPTLVFFTPNHKTLLIYPGFMSAKRLALTMEILKEKENHELNKDELFKKLFLAYKEKNV